MKNLILYLIAFVPIISFGQTDIDREPHILYGTVQSGDDPIPFAETYVRLTFFDSSNATLYVELHIAYTDEDGIYSVVIGSGEKKYGDVGRIDLVPCLLYIESDAVKDNIGYVRRAKIWYRRYANASITERDELKFRPDGTVCRF